MRRTSVAAAGEEGEIIALLAGDEAFEGYWQRPDADAKALRDGWYFTGDTGYVDADGDLFVTGRVDDMIITGGENVSPVEIESCLSLHPAVSEVAVVGLPDERWGKIVTAFIKRRRDGQRATNSTHFCRTSGPRQFQAAAPLRLRREIPKSPVGKLLRRKLVAGEYETEKTARQIPPRRKRQHDPDDLQRPAPGRRSTASASRSTPSRQRADIILDRPPFNVISMPQRDQLRLVFEALDEDARVRVIVLRAVGEHFSSGGNIKGFLEASARACLQARLEHRRAGALRQAGDRGQPRLLLRRRLRDLARLRLPHRLRNLPLRAAGAEARPDPRLRRLGAAAEDRRHHPHQGHRHALEAHSGQAGATTGASPPNASPTPSSKRPPMRWSTSCATFSPLAQRTAKKLLNDTEDSTLSIAIELEGHCYSRLRHSDDFREGVDAFHAKRPAQFKGS